MSSHRIARSAAFFAWSAAAACSVFWALRVGVSQPGLPVDVQPVSGAGALRGELSRLLGAGPAEVAEVVAPSALASRFKLVGVIAPKARANASAEPTRGVALIALDGKPARAFRVGSRVDGELMLQSVAQRSAQIGAANGAVALRLELAPLPAPSTGTLPSASAGLVREFPPLQVPPPGLAMPGVQSGEVMLAPAAPPPPPEGMAPEGNANPGSDPSYRR
jgi:general secretion pathway protein C